MYNLSVFLCIPAGIVFVWACVCVFDALTYSPLSLLSRGQVEDIHLISSVGFIVRLNVYGELLYKRACIPERQRAEMFLWLCPWDKKIHKM